MIRDFAIPDTVEAHDTHFDFPTCRGNTLKFAHMGRAEGAKRKDQIPFGYLLNCYEIRFLERGKEHREDHRHSVQSIREPHCRVDQVVSVILGMPALTRAHVLFSS